MKNRTGYIRIDFNNEEVETEIVKLSVNDCLNAIDYILNTISQETHTSKAEVLLALIMNEHGKLN